MMQRNRQAPPKYALGAMLLGVGAVALVGCGDNGNDATPAQATTSVPAPAAMSSPTATTSPPAGTATETGTAPAMTPNQAGAGEVQVLLRAGDTARAAVPGSTLISIETEHNGLWEVQVVTPDGTEHEMDVSADGATVVTGPTVDREDEADRAKHRDRVQAAQLDFRAATDRVLAEVPGATVTELNLDSENGTTVWEADAIDASHAKHEVTIDAVSGQTLWKTTG